MAGSRAKKIVNVDERGRVTLPANARKGVDSFAIETKQDGTIHLVPQKAVSLVEAKTLESLKVSIRQFKKGEVEDLPDDWIG